MRNAYIAALREQNAREGDPDRQQLTAPQEAIDLPIALRADHRHRRHQQQHARADDYVPFRLAPEERLHHQFHHAYTPLDFADTATHLPDMWNVLPTTYAVKNRIAIVPPNSGPSDRLIM